MKSLRWWIMNNCFFVLFMIRWTQKIMEVTNMKENVLIDKSIVFASRIIKLHRIQFEGWFRWLLSSTSPFFLLRKIPHFYFAQKKSRTSVRLFLLLPYSPSSISGSSSRLSKYLSSSLLRYSLEAKDCSWPCPGVKFSQALASGCFRRGLPNLQCPQ